MAPNELQVANRQDHTPFTYRTTSRTAAPAMRQAQRGDVRRGYPDQTIVTYVRRHRSLRTADASDDAAFKPSAVGEQAMAILKQMMVHMEGLAQATTSDAQRLAIGKIHEDTDAYCIKLQKL